MKNPVFVFIPIAAFLGGGFLLHGQSVAPQIEQSRHYDATNVPSLPPEESTPGTPMPSFAAESPGDDDLGQQVILKSKARNQPIAVYGGMDLSHTTNVGLTDDFQEDDWLWRSSLGVTYSPRFGNYLLGNFSLSQDVFRYDEFDELDFESLNIGAGLSYNLWFLYGINAGLAFNYNRLTAEDYGQEIFSNRTVTLTLSRNFILSRAHFLYLVGGANTAWSDPEEAERNEYTALAGYHVRIARDFEVDLSYRLGYNHYSEIDREDLSQTLQLTARYSFTPWLSANASISGSFNDSDRSRFDYEVLNTGVGFSLFWRF